MIPVPRDTGSAGPAEPAQPADDVARDQATEWALTARHGDPTAQAAFVRLTQAEVWRFAAALIGPDTADDLTQETYLRAFRALPAFEGRSSARTWLLGIARRACADHLRAVIRRRRLDERLTANAHTDRPHPDPSGQLGATDLVRRLSAERRSAFVLTQLLGLSYAEAAAVEGVPVGTIRSRVARARDELVEAVGDALAG
ncbi:sigma-70 family RNA polymerase sigma factor [Micromonospora sp. WMMC250]|uniref:sigma-70 family RNA polymerase sigma factor n=1 Tax=Micromonospora sp. WMMC250 TaxID=3014781 RepID=UPI0022B6410E|nr:sigma-70 family RNA polymerase sigma factor [Micromonospora sp. WMMC250]MCZ7376575.1 sigma-70 family RNA polymerase sigma factor [Micromonospora sp. WMMC250]